MHTDELELTIDGIAQGGEGVGRWQGQVVFVAGALPGERICVRVYERKAKYIRGAVEAVITPAAERVEPRLPDADHAPWQHIAYEAQLRFKQTIIREQMVKLSGLDEVCVKPVIPAPHPWNYRNSAHLHINGARVGYYAAGSHRIVDREADPLLLPVLNDTLRGLRSALAGQPQKKPAHVTLRASEAYGYAVAELSGAEDLTTLAKSWRDTVPTLAGVALPDNPHRRTITLYEELGDVVFSLTPASFFQINTAQAEHLLATIRAGLALQSEDRLLDAYSGAGAFALPLAKTVHEVVAIEENPQAVADGERTANLNAITNVRFITAPVERALSGLDGVYSAAILDPPRRGCHPMALAALLNLAPARIAYVSCHPAILARDVRPLIDAGYRLVNIQPVDLFPQTPHIESVALLKRQTRD